VDVVGDPNKGTGIRTRQEWFNTSAFAQPAAYTYGNEKVNPFTAQMRHEIDLSVLRRVPIGLGEKRYFEFRADAFNLFNNVVFGVPDATISDTNFGQITSQQNGPRQLQIAVKFYY
jgi:hypothetical protein